MNMSQKINQEEFDKKVTKAVKYGIPLGLIVTFIVITLDIITGAKGKLALYVAVAISVGGFVAGVGAVFGIILGIIKKPQ